MDKKLWTFKNKANVKGLDTSHKGVKRKKQIGGIVKEVTS